MIDEKFALGSIVAFFGSSSALLLKYNPNMIAASITGMLFMGFFAAWLWKKIDKTKLFSILFYGLISGISIASAAYILLFQPIGFLNILIIVSYGGISLILLKSSMQKVVRNYSH